MKAFPTINCTATPDWVESKSDGGMDLRDYFAAKAMQGILANPSGHSIRPIAEQAYCIADFMMEARK